MPVKTILAPLLGENRDRQTLNMALALARLSAGHVQAAFFHCDPRDAVSPQIGDGMSGGMIDSLMVVAQEQANAAARRARAAFDDWQGEDGIETTAVPAETSAVTASFEEIKGDLEKEVTRYGRLADIICTLSAGEDGSTDREIVFESALMASGRMVVQGPATAAVKPITHIAIAWNESREAARAVALAMPLLEVVEHVTVLAGTSNVVKPEGVEQFCASLKWHGVEATQRLFTPDSRRMSDQLQEEAEKAGAELLLLGAYSHSRLRETVFGGVTDDIVKGCRLPVLMAH